MSRCRVLASAEGSLGDVAPGLLTLLVRLKTSLRRHGSTLPIGQTGKLASTNGRFASVQFDGWGTVDVPLTHLELVGR